MSESKFGANLTYYTKIVTDYKKKINLPLINKMT